MDYSNATDGGEDKLPVLQQSQEPAVGGERRTVLKARSVINSVRSLGQDPRSSSYLLLMKPNYMKERHPLVAHEDEKAQLALQLN